MFTLFGSRARTFWVFQTAGWLGYALLRIFHGLTIDWGFDYFDTTVVATATGFVLTTALRYIYRPLKTRPLALVVPVVLAVCAVFALLFSAIEVTAGTYYDPEGLIDLGLFENAMFDAFVLIAWSGLYFGLQYYEQLQRQQEATLKAAAMAQEAQLAMLRYQLNPHFLFNTLNAISTLVLARETEQANRMLAKLAAFLRYTLINPPEQKVTLEQELEALNLYLDIETVRFGPRLTTTYEIEERARIALVPSLILQPLVENAIKYAIAPSEDGGVIRVEAAIEDNLLCIALIDDGPGLPDDPTPPDARSSGVGLKNTRARLAEIYGPAHSLTLDNLSPRGLAARICIPYERMTRTGRRVAAR